MLLVKTVVNTPRAIAIVLGHLNVSLETLQRYTHYYTDRNCSVVAAASPPLRFLLNKSLRPVAQEILLAVEELLMDTPREVPVVLHSFSNGGAFLLEELETLLLHNDGRDNEVQEQNSDTQTKRLTESGKKLILSRLRLGYQIFDSCPCHIRLAWDLSNLTKSFPHPKLLLPVRVGYALLASLSLTLWLACTRSLYRPAMFWTRMTQSECCMHQIYVYTTCDLLSDASQVDQLIETRRTLFPNVDISSYRYHDSNHCQLDRDHPVEYGMMIDKALQAALKRASS